MGQLGATRTYRVGRANRRTAENGGGYRGLPIARGKLGGKSSAALALPGIVCPARDRRPAAGVCADARSTGPSWALDADNKSRRSVVPAVPDNRTCRIECVAGAVAADADADAV